ncbi:MAG: hypothetical protein A2V74_04570 [Acidobacteria bacterium RBG_16_70_10]|nr:MAG: hypothetical protein A2V74_04570 [Acidobacteria bacterium RBG_16_70_10]
MTCEDLRRQLVAYEDKMLSDAVCAELQRHLTECDSCQALWDDLAILRRICRSCDSPRLPEGLRRRLQARLGEPDP